MIRISLLATLLVVATAKHVPSARSTQDEFINTLLSWRDTKTDPCDNFYRYACGAKLDEDDSKVPFQNVMVTQQIETYQRIAQLLQNSDGTQDPTFEKASKFFESCLYQDVDENVNALMGSVKDLGGWPIASSSWKSPGDTLTSILPLMGKIARTKIGPGLLNTIVMPDPFDTSKTVVQFFQPGQLIFLPAPLLINKVALARSIVSYASIISNGHSPSLREAMHLVDLNNKLWETMAPMTPQMKDNYERMTVADFHKMTQIDVKVYLNALFEGVTTFNDDDTVVVASIPYYTNLHKVLAKFDTKTLVDFEMMNLVLPSMQEGGILDAKMKGRTEVVPVPQAPTRLPRPEGTEPKTMVHPEWVNLAAREAGQNMNILGCIQKAASWFSFTIAKEYVHKFFTQNERTKAKETTEEIMKVFESRLDTMDWMDESAKAESKNKLKNIKETYVYAEWVDNQSILEKFYETFHVASNYMTNLWEAFKFIRTTNFRLLSKSKLPLNVSITFDIGPLDVNAYYSPSENAINILAGIIQPPIFSDDRLELFNYATLGSIIGHEITHGFDNQGQQFDEHGNLRDWMSPKVHDTFMYKAQCYVDQYNEYKLTSEDFPMFGFRLHINGSRTLGENIADNGGFQQAFWAYKAWASKHGEEKLPASLSEFTPEQVFFLTYAHLWCNKYHGTQQELLVLMIDVHTPGKFRVIGTLSNFDEFSKAFNCKSKSLMNRGDDRCELW